MSQIDAGASPDWELKADLPDDGRETPAISTGSNSPDVNSATPGGGNGRGDGDGDQGP